MNFNKIRRQKFLTEKKYLEEEGAIKYGRELSKKSLESNKPKAPRADSSFRWHLAYGNLKLLLLYYTAGRPIPELRDQLPDVIEGFDFFMANKVLPSEMNPPTNEADTFEISQLDAYVCVLWLLALCKLLRHDEFVWTVMKWVNRTYKFNRGRDGLFESVVQKLTGNHVETKPVLFHPVYVPLARATVAAPEERPALVKEFVESWYKGMKSLAWHGTHSYGGSYYGYWCLEAALVTALWDIDDSSYRDHLVYPKDLVDWYRAQKNLAG